MIEIAIAVVIMLLGAGGYQALASVDFKPIVIKLPERKMKVIETKPVKVENYWHHWVDERADHERTKDKLTKAIEGKNTWYKAFEKAIEDHDATRRQYGLELIGNNQFETGSGEIFFRPTISGNNGIQHVDIYQSNYLDRIEKRIGKHLESQPGCIWCTSDYLCTNCKYMHYGHY